MIPQKDIDVVRGLAAEQARIAALPVHKEKWEMWRRLNSLEPVRPMVWINQVPWHEMDVDGELTLQTTHPLCRAIENGLRRTLYQWKHFPADTIVDGQVYCPIVHHDTGFGIEEKSEKIRVAPQSVASRAFEPIIREESDVEKIQMPEISVDLEATERRYEQMAEILAGVITVTKRGIPIQPFAPWDELVRWWGVQEVMMDLVLRPQMVHRAMDRLVSAHLYRLDQREALGLLAFNGTNIKVGSGGFGCTRELPAGDFDPNHVQTKDNWGSCMAQIFSEVSPEMHEEFALRHERRWLDRFGLAYYGCCEPLHSKVRILETIPNLRKISMSPWADLDVAAETIEDRHVISFKPNPAHVAGNRWNPEFVRRYLREALEKTRERGCVVEVVLKDISTVRNEPKRLWEWSRVAMEVAEEFA